jgi:hypothetical protein
MPAKMSHEWDGIPRIRAISRRLGVPLASFMLACVRRTKHPKLDHPSYQALQDWWDKAMDRRDIEK